MNDDLSRSGHLAAGAMRVGRRYHRYDETVSFYRDVVGRPLLHLAASGVDDVGRNLTASLSARDRAPAGEPEPHQRV